MSEAVRVSEGSAKFARGRRTLRLSARGLRAGVARGQASGSEPSGRGDGKGAPSIER